MTEAILSCTCVRFSSTNCYSLNPNPSCTCVRAYVAHSRSLCRVCRAFVVWYTRISRLVCGMWYAVCGMRYAVRRTSFRGEVSFAISPYTVGVTLTRMYPSPHMTHTVGVTLGPRQGGRYSSYAPSGIAYE
jgi:hypothetical protein